VTLIPLAWLLVVTLDAGAIKVWDPNPKIGFFAAVHAAEGKLPVLEQAFTTAQAGGDAGAIAAAAKAFNALRTTHFNSTIDAWVTCAFIFLVAAIVVLTVGEWIRLLTRQKATTLSETEPVYIPVSAVGASNPVPVFSIALLGFTLLKELSGEAAIDRAEVCACASAGISDQSQPAKYRRQNAFLTATEDRYRGVNRCC
jgi:carbon starvation protein